MLARVWCANQCGTYLIQAWSCQEIIDPSPQSYLALFHLHFNFMLLHYSSRLEVVASLQVSPEEAAALNDLEQKMARHALDKAAIDTVVGPIFNNQAILRHVPISHNEAQERVLFHVRHEGTLIAFAPPSVTFIALYVKKTSAC